MENSTDLSWLGTQISSHKRILERNIIFSLRKKLIYLDNKIRLSIFLTVAARSSTATATDVATAVRMLIRAAVVLVWWTEWRGLIREWTRRVRRLRRRPERWWFCKCTVIGRGSKGRWFGERTHICRPERWRFCRASLLFFFLDWFLRCMLTSIELFDRCLAGTRSCPETRRMIIWSRYKNVSNRVPIKRPDPWLVCWFYLTNMFILPINAWEFWNLDAMVFFVIFTQSSRTWLNRQSRLSPVISRGEGATVRLNP